VMLTQLALLPLTLAGHRHGCHQRNPRQRLWSSMSRPRSRSRPRAVRPMTGTSLLYVFVDGHPGSSVFENGDTPSAARTRGALHPSGNSPGCAACREPASVATLDSGLRVQFSCSGRRLVKWRRPEPGQAAG